MSEEAFNGIQMIFKVSIQTKILRKRDDCNAGILSFSDRPGMARIRLVLCAVKDGSSGSGMWGCGLDRTGSV
jgi:hypothetical protein